MTHTLPSAHVIALSELHDSARPDLPVLVPDAINPLHDIKARLQVCVGDVVITVGELLSLREQQVITLNQKVNAPVDVLLEGKVVARGQLVAVDDRFAVRVTQLPVPLKP